MAKYKPYVYDQRVIIPISLEEKLVDYGDFVSAQSRNLAMVSKKSDPGRLKVLLLGFLIRGITQNLNVSRTANWVKRILGISNCQIFNAAIWRDTICWGYLRTAKSEGSVPPSATEPPETPFPICETYLQFLEKSRGSEKTAISIFQVGFFPCRRDEILGSRLQGYPQYIGDIFGFLNVLTANRETNKSQAFFQGMIRTIIIKGSYFPARQQKGNLFQ